MNIIKIHTIDARDDEILSGDAIITDSKGQECHVEWTYYISEEDALILDFTINGFELGFNDRWVESENEYGHVCTEYDPAKKQYLPVPTETVFISDEDFDALDKAINDFGAALTEKANAAASAAWLAVINAAKDPNRWETRARLHADCTRTRCLVGNDECKEHWGDE